MHSPLLPPGRRLGRGWPGLAPAATLVLLAASALASPPRPDPLDPAAPVPPLLHRSAVAEHRSLPATGRDWREANDTVGRLGGWRGHLGPASGEPAAPGATVPAAAAGRGAPATPPPDPQPGPSGHGGHQGHQGHQGHPSAAPAGQGGPQGVGGAR